MGFKGAANPSRVFVGLKQHHSRTTLVAVQTNHSRECFGVGQMAFLLGFQHRPCT